MVTPSTIDRFAYWLTLAAPFWMIRQEWFKCHVLPRAGVYAYYEEYTNDQH